MLGFLLWLAFNGSPSYPKLIQWHETTWEDFVDGEQDPSLYVSRRAELEPDSGCIEFLVYFDVNQDEYIDIPSVDEHGPQARIFLGSNSGYSNTKSLTYDISAGGNALTGDLNGDRNPELILSGHDMGNTIIYWGTPTGPSPSTPTILTAHGGNEAVSVGDFDHDAYPDIVVGYEDGNGWVSVFWGGQNGYTPSNRTDIYIGGLVVANLEVADFNRDGWLDIASINQSCNLVITYWGPNRTYWNITLPFVTEGEPHGLSCADFNADGWLDLVLTGFRTIQQSYIYWGSSGGFNQTNRTVVNPGPCYGGSVVADFNGDSLLDIVYLRGFWTSNRPIAYYNTGMAEFFDDSHSAELGTTYIDASGGISGDFDFDGIPDIFVCGRPYTSYVLYGPDCIRINSVNGNYDHHGAFRELGNIYDRTPTAFYLSSIYDAGEGNRITAGTCSWVAHETTGKFISVFFHSGDTPIPDSTWTPFVRVESNGDSIPSLSLGGRYLQYKILFSYDRPSPFPTLEAITANLIINPIAAFDVGVQRVVTPTGTVDSGVVIVPEAIVRNYGTQPAQFPVTMLIGSDYSETESLSLEPGKIDTVKFSSWTAHPVGALPVVCFTSLSNDENRSNDTAKTSVAVQGEVLHDVGTIEILAPVGTIRTGDTVIPRASVRNFGTSTERYFNVRFRIGTVYDRIVTVNSSVEPNSAVQVSFPSWIATPGVHTVSCSTMLVIDAHPENDKLTRTITVGGTQHQDTLLIEWDQEDCLEIGERKSYSFYAELKSDSGGFVEIHPPQVPTNWSGVLFDSAGGKVLSDNNGNGIPDLGYVSPYRRYYFTLQVEAPQGLIGDTGALTTITFNLRGFLSRDSLVKDSAILKIKLVPKLSIHNFPNPFEDKTTFVIGLPEDGRITLTVYNRVGELLCRVTEKEFHSAGIHFIPWDGRNNRGRPVAPGTYHYLLEYEHKGKTDRIRKKLVRSGK